jgi:hypothetical protein
MDEINAIVQIINSCGFPIVACGVLFYLYNKTIEKFTETLSKIERSLETLINNLDHICKYNENGGNSADEN